MTSITDRHECRATSTLVGRRFDNGAPMPGLSPLSLSQRTFELELRERQAAGYFVAAGAAIGGAALLWSHCALAVVGSVLGVHVRTLAVVYLAFGLLNFLAVICVRSQR